LAVLELKLFANLIAIKASSVKTLYA